MTTCIAVHLHHGGSAIWDAARAAAGVAAIGERSCHLSICFFLQVLCPLHRDPASAIPQAVVH